jgi:hypothetical protein
MATRFASNVFYVEFENAGQGGWQYRPWVHHGPDGMAQFQALFWEMATILPKYTEERPLLELIIR